MCPQRLNNFTFGFSKNNFRMAVKKSQRPVPHLAIPIPIISGHFLCIFSYTPSFVIGHRVKKTKVFNSYFLFNNYYNNFWNIYKKSTDENFLELCIKFILQQKM